MLQQHWGVCRLLGGGRRRETAYTHLTRASLECDLLVHYTHYLLFALLTCCFSDNFITKLRQDGGDSIVLEGEALTLLLFAVLY